MSNNSSFEQTLSSMLDDLVETCGQHVAVVGSEYNLSFLELDTKVRAVANGFRKMGIQYGDCVAVWLNGAPEWLIVEFALARLGAVTMAVNTRYRTTELEDLLFRGQVKALITQKNLGGVETNEIIGKCKEERLKGLRYIIDITNEMQTNNRSQRYTTVNYNELVRENSEGAPDKGRWDSPCNVFTSSGSTGSPKLILHCQGSVVGYARAVGQCFGYTHGSDNIILEMLPLCGVFGFDLALASLASGQTCVLLPEFNAEGVVRAIEQYGVTHTAGSDEMYRRIFAIPDSTTRCCSLREGAFGAFGASDGEPIDLIDEGDRRGIRLFQTYGATEVHALMAYPRADADRERRALGGGVVVSSKIVVRVCDPVSGEALPIGRQGELQIKGPNVTAGYLRDSEREPRIVDGYLKTNDLGYMVSEAEFVYLARMDDALRLSGFLVDPREIELFLERDESIEGARVVGIKANGRECVVAFIIIKAGTTLNEKVIIDKCKEGLAYYKVPKRIFVIDKFPMTMSANGERIRRKDLREMALKLLGY